MLAETIFSGFISKVINDCVDISKDKIVEAIKAGKNKHQNLESQIYNITVDTLNDITGNKYKNRDILFDAAEKILRGFKDNKTDNMDVVRSSLHNIVERVDNDKCREFIRLLYHEISKEEYSDLYKEILLLKLEQGNTHNQEGFRLLKRELDRVIKLLEEKDVMDNENGISECKEFINNKRHEYIRKWNSRLFLHIDNDEKPLTLANTFIMPDYKVHSSINRIEFSDDDTLDIVIEKFIKYDITSTMLITGVPGIGKSSITSWIANKYKDDDRVIILRFRDWEAEELNNGITKAVCHTLKCRYSDLNNKILIIDGFDEMKALDIREQVLNRFAGEILDWENIKIIFTSRPNYINFQYFQNVIELSTFNTNKIECFLKKIIGNKLAEKRKIESNLEVLGIPVILYMAAVSDVDISENSTKPELYGKIFAEKGGIFDKFCIDGIAYDRGKQVLRNSENIRKYLDFLGTAAFEMFETNNLTLKKDDCKIPKMAFEEKRVSILDFPIKHFFENTEVNIEFIHKSIYEYFVSEYIFMVICKGLKGTEEKLAGDLGSRLKSNRLTNEILEFLNFKVHNTELTDNFSFFVDTFKLMLQDGMTYYTNKVYKDVIDCELRVFANMLELIHLWEFSCLKLNDKIEKYIKYYQDVSFNLEYLNLSCLDLSYLDLSRAYLSEAGLRRTALRGANLNGVDLRGAYVSIASLSGVDLSDVNLNGVMLD